EFRPAYGHYESSLITKSIAAALFNSPNSVGATFCEYFDPMPLTTVAFILATMQFCIEEWETGQWQLRDLSASDMLNKYVAHLRGLKAARAAAKFRMRRLVEHWHGFGVEYSGTAPTEQSVYQPITLQNEVRLDTLISDDNDARTTSSGHSEYEDALFSANDKPEIDGDGRYTAKAKGKGRA
ncbi:hypothetical protein FRC10_005438, partial [Ceratobasidium sp. 414]